VILLAATATGSTFTQAEAIRVLSTYADAQSSADLLSPAQINQFDLDANGAVTLSNTFDLSLQSSTLHQAALLQLSSSGTNLYVAGQFNIARLSRDPASGALTLIQELQVDTTQPIVGMTLSPDQSHLYVITKSPHPTAITNCCFLTANKASSSVMKVSRVLGATLSPGP